MERRRVFRLIAILFTVWALLDMSTAEARSPRPPRPPRRCHPGATCQHGTGVCNDAGQCCGTSEFVCGTSCCNALPNVGCCDGACVYTDTEENCGSCGNVCLGGDTCQNGLCIGSACPAPDWRSCGTIGATTYCALQGTTCCVGARDATGCGAGTKCAANLDAYCCPIDDQVCGISVGYPCVPPGSQCPQ